MTTSDLDELRENAVAALEALAHATANANYVEEAWTLRGVADAISDRLVAPGRAEAGEYAADYLKGYNI